MTGRPDWAKVREVLELPADAAGPEILAAMRATGVLGPDDARPCAESTGVKPRAYLDATQAASKLGVDLRKVGATGAGGRITAEDVERFARRWEPVPAAVYVNRLAAELDVELDQVAGSGPDGSTTARDVIAAARLNASTVTALAAGRFPAGDAYRPNPLVDDIRRDNPAVYRAASAQASPPTLFAGGDLPTFTTSGLTPVQLAQLPWQARHAAAAAPSASDAYRIVEEVSGPDGDLVAEEYARHRGNLDYQTRVQRWALGMAEYSSTSTQLGQRDADLPDALLAELDRVTLPPPNYRDSQS